MKKILIITSGKVAEHFLNRVIETYTSENIYYVVQPKEKKFENAGPARFKFYEFDPTSLYKLSNLLKMEFVQVIIAMDNQTDVEITIKNIRAVKKQLRVIVLNLWNMESTESDVVLVNANEILASRLLDYLPNVPVIAQNVGVGEGEIMEVLVPFGSSFVYRHIGAIEQKNWRIVAIYRERKLVMPSRRRMIQPNDTLLLVGEPAVLKSVYKAIKRELGQFPEPFGSNILLYIDMNIIKQDKIKELVEQAVYVHEKFHHTLIIKVVNPRNIELLEYIKNLRTFEIIVNIEYDIDLHIKSSFLSDINKYHIGLVVVSADMFSDYYVRKSLYEVHVPVLKISQKKLSDVKDIALILSDNRDLEKMSATVFDIAEQLNLNIGLYNYINEHQENREQVIEHFNNLSTIFSKSIKVYNETANPIRELQKKENFMQIIPFTAKLTQRQIFSFFSTDSEKLYHKLDSYTQIFIPVQL